MKKIKLIIDVNKEQPIYYAFEQVCEKLNELVDRVNELFPPEKKEERKPINLGFPVSPELSKMVENYVKSQPKVEKEEVNDVYITIKRKDYYRELEEAKQAGILMGKKEEPTQEFTKEELEQIREFIAWDSNSKEYTEEIMNSILSKIERLLK